MFEELGTRQERLSIGIPVWVAAVAMSYVGVPWPVIAPLGIVALVLVAGSMTSTAQGATLVQLAIAAPLIAGHVAVAMPEQPLTMPRIGASEPIVQMRPPVPSEVAEAETTPYAACLHWGAREAVNEDCPNCQLADRRHERQIELSGLPDARKCERIFAHTFTAWRSRTAKDCQALATERPRLAKEFEAAGGLCTVVTR